MDVLANAEDHVEATYNVQFELPGDIWNLYIFQQVTLDQSEDGTDCGVKCELHDAQCDFYAYEAPTCYLGLYSHYSQGKRWSTFFKKNFPRLN